MVVDRGHRVTPTRWSTQCFVEAILENGRFAIRSVQEETLGCAVVGGGVLLIAPFCEHGRWRAPWAISGLWLIAF